MNVSRSVLIVDDEVIIRTSLEILLRKKGYRVKTAKNAEKAMEILTEFNPHIMVIDMNMPGMNGLELTKLVLKERDCQIILFTGFFDLASKKDEFPEQGIIILQKPVDVEHLLAVMGPPVCDET